MHPSSILSYYATYALFDEIVSHNNSKTLHLYIDLKNCLQSLYMEHAIVNILETTILSGKTDSSIFSSVISFIAFNKLYAIKRNLNIKFYFFFETGVSYYHNNISKKYKISRRIDDLYGLDKVKRDLFFEITHKNYGLIEQCCNKLPNVNVIRLQNLEADFIPYYLIRNKLVNITPEVAHIVFSNDHDMLQTLTAGEHTYVFQKHAKSKKVRRRGEALLGELKVKTTLADEIQPLAMSILGDPGDDVDGIKNVGPSRFLANVDDLLRATGGIQQLYQNVMNGKPIFDPTSIRNPNKYLNKILSAEKKKKFISNNLKLVSFELLSRFVDDPQTVEMMKYKKFIHDTVTNNGTASREALVQALWKIGVELYEEDLNTIYFGT